MNHLHNHPFPTRQSDLADAALRAPKASADASAGLPVSNPSRSFWIESPEAANILAKEGSQDHLPAEVDICIIGSGITGVSAAYHLAKLFKGENHGRAPIRAIILEARDFCSGATGRNGGYLRPWRFGGFVRREKAYGREETKKVYKLEQYTTSELVHIIDKEGLINTVDLALDRSRILCVTEQEELQAKEDFAAANAAGLDLEDVQWHNREEISSTCGVSFPAYSSPTYTVWPLKLVTQLYRLASTLNPHNFSLTLHTSTPVTCIERLSPPAAASTLGLPPRWLLRTPKGLIRCAYVVHATNAYASYLLPHMAGPNGIIPTRSQCMALRYTPAATAAPALAAAPWAVNDDFEYWFTRPRKDGERPLMIIGGGRDITGPEWEYYTTDDSVVRRDVSEMLVNVPPMVFPGLYEREMVKEMEWSGIMGYTVVGDPFVGPVVVPSSPSETGTRDEVYEGQYIAAGYRGHGMPRAYACAEVIAGMIVAHMNGTAWIAPEWFPRHFLTTERL